MTWSTRQLADLAGSTVKTVRYYHQVGLLEEPERAVNGYKRYRVSHLVRLLRIKRLVDLGMPLTQIAAIGLQEERPGGALLVIDAELGSTIERLQRVRAELSLVLRDDALVDLPAPFTTAMAGLSNSDRTLILIYSRILDQSAMNDLRQMLLDPSGHALRAEFDALPFDADEGSKQILAERYAPFRRSLTARFPWLDDMGAHTTLESAAAAESIIADAMADLYNPAQLDVMRRSNLISRS